MKARMSLTEPREIEASLTITMKVKEWEQLRDQLNGSWPSWKLSAHITDLLSQVRRIVYPKSEDEE